MNEDLRRRFFAEEVQAVSNLQTAPLVDALAIVRREQFLPPGPWVIRSEGDLGAQPRWTPDADTRHVYHNVSIGLDPSRELFNGAPGLVASWIDAVGIKPRESILHVGCGMGYYSALMAHCAQAEGSVVAVDIDDALVSEARHRLAYFVQVEVRQGDGLTTPAEMFDVIFVNAGVTHPHKCWLDALKQGGRLVVPITCTMPGMGTLSKGFVLLLERPEQAGKNDELKVRVITNFVSIYTAVRIRDATLNEAVGKALMRGPYPVVRRLRRDAHPPSPSCWLHAEQFCLSG